MVTVASAWSPREPAEQPQEPGEEKRHKIARVGAEGGGSRSPWLLRGLRANLPPPLTHLAAVGGATTSRSEVKGY